ncbi:hypothetical protein IQ260_24575 [Leptolyngbya cf. ectocarpi LEGE 11479]|uniref:Uncharacterized protein n=1 Tax=Leptolyngbya cf. ectocarpi LEGE 11479 TaxID=1828722 RepID=A0A928ZYK3_LEPEC|nr:hypothetical protein [Leptolyngbya ectocarpi]MBE9069822.1 hypothetical protein [Leptolyngbya cf. ectocarpi LEGE 11479]
MADSCLSRVLASGRSYLDLCQQIQPGDVLAFSGCDVPSSVVKMATQSCYVHVAIVLSVDWTAHHEDPILIAESHIDISLPSEGSGKTQLGVQFQRLSNRIMAAQGPVWWAPLRVPLLKHQLTQMRAWLHQIEAQGVPYDFPQAVGAGVDILDDAGLSNQPDFEALFCSELVTRALQIANIVAPEVNPSEKTPADVMQFSCLKKPILICNAPTG